MAYTYEQRQVLALEVQTDPLTRGYAGMTDAELLASLQVEDRSRNRTSMSGDEIFQATVATDFSALDDGSGSTSDVQGIWVSFCGRDTVDPFGASNVAFVQHVFGGGSQTVANLASDRVEDISRLQELGLPVPTEHQISQAR